MNVRSTIRVSQRETNRVGDRNYLRRTSAARFGRSRLGPSPILPRCFGAAALATANAILLGRASVRVLH
jgi:hypothetical protein